MLNPIGQPSRIIGFAQEQIFSATQQQLIKKIALIASLALGIAFAVYALYRVASFCFSKKEVRPAPITPVVTPATKERSPLPTMTPAPKSHLPSPALKLEHKSPPPSPVPIPEPKTPPLPPVLHPAHKSPSPSHVLTFAPTSAPPPLASVLTPAPTTSSSPASVVTPVPTSSSPAPVATPVPAAPTPVLAATVVTPIPAAIPVPSISVPIKSAKQIALEKEYDSVLLHQKYSSPNTSVLHLIISKYNQDPDQAIELIDFALTQGVNIDVVDPSKRTVLHCSWNLKIAEHLLACGANPNVKDASGDTPLHHVSKLDIIKALVDKGAHLDITNSKDRTILETHLANYINEPCNQEKEEIVEFLLTKGAKLHSGNYKGELLKKAFEMAIFTRDGGDTRRKALEIAKRLIAFGADLKTSDPKGALFVHCLRTAIHYSDEVKEVKDFLFDLADLIGTLVPKLSVSDPTGKLMVEVFEKVINNNSNLWSGWRQYYLKVVDKLSAMGSVSLAIADPVGKLLYRILTAANQQSPNNEPSFLEPYYEVADKLIQMGESLEKMDPDSWFLRDALEKAASSYDDKRLAFYCAIANALIKRGAYQTPHQKTKIDDFLKGLADHKREKLTKNVKF